MPKQVDIMLHSDHPIETCFTRLSEEMDVDERTIFSLSGYKGHSSILGRITGNEFRLHKRPRGHNSFAPILFGRLQPDGRGTLLEGYWGVWPGTRVFMRVWTILVALIGIPIFVLSLQDGVRRGFAGAGDWWVGLLLPPGLVLWGYLLPRLGAAISASEKDYMVGFLERTLVAGKTSGPGRERNWDSTFDRLWR